MISLAAVAGVAYYSDRAKSQTDSLAQRVTVLEQASRDSASRVARSRADRRRLCTNVDRVRQKITGVVLLSGTPAPNFDVQADCSWTLVGDGHSPQKQCIAPRGSTTVLMRHVVSVARTGFAQSPV